jgi:hypothetical protein
MARFSSTCLSITKQNQSRRSAVKAQFDRNSKCTMRNSHSLLFLILSVLDEAGSKTRVRPVLTVKGESGQDRRDEATTVAPAAGGRLPRILCCHPDRSLCLGGDAERHSFCSRRCRRRREDDVPFTGSPLMTHDLIKDDQVLRKLLKILNRAPIGSNSRR